VLDASPPLLRVTRAQSGPQQSKLGDLFHFVLGSLVPDYRLTP